MPNITQGNLSLDLFGGRSGVGEPVGSQHLIWPAGPVTQAAEGHHGEPSRAELAAENAALRAKVAAMEKQQHAALAPERARVAKKPRKAAARRSPTKATKQRSVKELYAAKWGTLTQEEKSCLLLPLLEGIDPATGEKWAEAGSMAQEEQAAGQTAFQDVIGTGFDEAPLDFEDGFLPDEELGFDANALFFPPSSSSSSFSPSSSSSYLPPLPPTATTATTLVDDEADFGSLLTGLEGPMEEDPVLLCPRDGLVPAEWYELCGM
ncbi:hypothetical protein GQ44DRAFT_721437 [Phaeosphaeriaceae sp. PMI808]|nr:hypothetical protein GQ44DRAFT_721437 [Phaeosphaeriaceae sp. PMI808]